MSDQREAVQGQLDRWGPAVAGTALAKLALGLADRLDDGETPATAYASIARELHSVLADLEAAAPKVVVQDSVQSSRDELKARREQARERGA